MIGDELASLLPTATETQFLRAALHDLPSAREAWDAWLDAVTREGTSTRRALAPVNALIPLLSWNLWRNQVPLDRDLETLFRAAHLTEELRLGAYQAICQSAFDTLSGAGVPFVVLKGAALGSMVYPAPVLRHAQDLDLLLDGQDLERAATSLTRAGWHRTAPRALANPLHMPGLAHPSGVVVELHRRLLIPYYTVPYDRLRERSMNTRVGNADVRVLSPADNLLHTCAHAMAGFPILRWVPDAWFVLKCHPDLSWPTFLSTVVESRLELPVGVALEYLAERMSMPIPEDLIDDLRKRAAHSTRMDRSAARPWPAGQFRDLWARPEPWWRRLALMGRRLFPPPQQFALHYGLRPWTVPYHYLHRAWLHLSGRQDGVARRKSGVWNR